MLVPGCQGFCLFCAPQADSSAIQPFVPVVGEEVLGDIELAMDNASDLSADDNYILWAGSPDENEDTDDGEGPALGIAVAAEPWESLGPVHGESVNVDAGAGDVVAKRGWQHHDLSHRWKTFQFTYSPPNVKPPAGQWYGRCGYHKLNSVTWCSKSVSIKAGEDPVNVKMGIGGPQASPQKRSWVCTTKEIAARGRWGQHQLGCVGGTCCTVTTSSWRS